MIPEGHTEIWLNINPSRQSSNLTIGAYLHESERKAEEEELGGKERRRREGEREAGTKETGSEGMGEKGRWGGRRRTLEPRRGGGGVVKKGGRVSSGQGTDSSVPAVAPAGGCLVARAGRGIGADDLARASGHGPARLTHASARADARGERVSRRGVTRRAKRRAPPESRREVAAFAAGAGFGEAAPPVQTFPQVLGL